ncbi:glycosyltransferase [Salinibacter ruber]|uniref:glycosyltransferase n=1 Tax=Salinibacter ruber TaxID=146919 RepID=UPI0013C2D2AB|nr:glycosyltransferase [Salinibacter ruber]
MLTISSLDRTAGGTSSAVAAMARHLAGRDPDVSVVSLESDQPLLDEAGTEEGTPTVTLVRRDDSPWKVWQNPSRFGRALHKEIEARSNVVVHDNGLWLPVNHRVATTTHSLACPRVVSPHGMLEPWSLGQGAWKKKAAWWLYQKRDLQSAEVVVATAEQEAQNIRALGVDGPIAVVPNGVDRPDSLPSVDNDTSGGGEQRRLLFLSRIHKKKGLLNLVEAWDRLRPDGWEVIIAGPDENGHEAEVRERISQCGVKGDFVFTGPVKGMEKWKMYQSADLFVLPTHSENFGIVVAEALSCGVPVITTRGAPWSDLVDHDCGWWIEIGVDPLVEALVQATRMSAADRVAMGRRGRELVDRKYTWPQVAAALESVYAWVLGEQRHPECVIT